MPVDASPPPHAASEPCPVCSRAIPDQPTERKYHPFCSRRCQQVDLMRWMNGRYAITEELPDDEPFLQDE